MTTIETEFLSGKLEFDSVFFVFQCTNLSELRYALQICFALNQTKIDFATLPELFSPPAQVLVRRAFSSLLASGATLLSYSWFIFNTA